MFINNVKPVYHYIRTNVIKSNRIYFKERQWHHYYNTTTPLEGITDH